MTVLTSFDITRTLLTVPDEECEVCNRDKSEQGAGREETADDMDGMAPMGGTWDEGTANVVGGGAKEAGERWKEAEDIVGGPDWDADEAKASGADERDV